MLKIQLFIYWRTSHATSAYQIYYVFQVLLYSCFRRLTSKLVETLLLLSTGHLFGLYNPNQVADVLAIPKAKLYRHLKDFSLYHRTFGTLLLIYFLDMGKMRTMMVFGKPCDRVKYSGFGLNTKV